MLFRSRQVEEKLDFLEFALKLGEGLEFPADPGFLLQGFLGPAGILPELRAGHFPGQFLPALFHSRKVKDGCAGFGNPYSVFPNLP